MKNELEQYRGGGGFYFPLAETDFRIYTKDVAPRWIINIKLPDKFNKTLHPHAIFGQEGAVPEGMDELEQFAYMFDRISQQFKDWAIYIRKRKTQDLPVLWECQTCHSFWSSMDYCQRCGKAKNVNN